MVALPKLVPFQAGDVRAIADFVRPHVEPWISGGQIVITDPTLAYQGEFDAVTNERVYVPHVVWFGPARIQPLRTALLSQRPANDSTTRVVQFQIGWLTDNDLPDIRAGFQIDVTDGGNDTHLSDYMYYVTGAINSSSGWQRTIETQSDLERRPEWTTVMVDTGAQEGQSVVSEFSVDGGTTWLESYSGMGDAQVPQFDVAGVTWRVTVS